MALSTATSILLVAFVGYLSNELLALSTKINCQHYYHIQLFRYKRGVVMKTIRNLAVAGCSILLLSQCATQDEVRELNYQLRAVNQKVEDVKTNTVNQMQKRQANSVNKIGQVEDETNRIKSMIEENAHQSSLLREQTKENLADISTAIEAMRGQNEKKFVEFGQRLDGVEQKLAQIINSFERIQQSRIREAEQKAQAAAKRAESARKRTVVAASSTIGFVKVHANKKKIRVGSGKVVDDGSQTKKTTQTAAATPQKRNSVQTVTTADTVSGPFSEAMGHYRNKKYKEAYRSFEQVLANNPRGHRAAETLYYMGECLYNQGEFDLAILDYQKVISNHAKDNLTPGALLKQGMSFEQLTDHETAKIIYKKLIKDYAQSGEAAKAKERLGKL